MVVGFRLSDGQAMRQQQTSPAQPPAGRVRRTVLSWAGQYALPTAVVSAGILFAELSPGVGWALIVFGASLAAFALQRPRPSGAGVEAEHRNHPARAHLARRQRRPRLQRIDRANGADPPPRLGGARAARIRARQRARAIRDDRLASDPRSFELRSFRPSGLLLPTSQLVGTSPPPPPAAQPTAASRSLSSSVVANLVSPDPRLHGPDVWPARHRSRIGRKRDAARCTQLGIAEPVAVGSPRPNRPGRAARCCRAYS